MVEDTFNVGEYKAYKDERVEIDADRNLVIYTDKLYDEELFLKATNVDEVNSKPFYVKIEAKVYNFPPFFMTELP